MMSPEHDPEAWSAFMCGNAILESEFAKHIQNVVFTKAQGSS